MKSKIQRKSPANRVLRAKMKPVSEKAIQAQILAWLKTTEILHWRQNAGVLFVGSRMVNLGSAGLPDIVVVVPPGGRFLGLEVKSEAGRLRPAQEAFKAKLEASGGIYEVVRTLGQAKEAVERAFNG